MVGVAGKSQACNTCKQRRVKCDFGRPSCLRCIKAKRTCAGYGHERIFVNRTPSNPLTSAESVLSGCRARQSSHQVAVDPTTVTTLHQLYLDSRRDDCYPFREHAAELLKQLYLPKQSLFTALQTDTNDGSFSWVYHLSDLTLPSSSLDASLFAFCLAQLHVTGRGDISLYQCLEQYTSALQQLHVDLDSSDARVREETLAAIVTLSTCELFVCPAEHGWSAHVHGIAEILRLRGTETRVTPAWRHLFSRMKIICTLEALTKRHSLRENNIWQQVVSEDSLTGDLDQILQLAARMSPVLERATMLPSIDNPATLLKESEAIICILLSILNSMELWHDGFRKQSSTSRAWAVPSYATNPTDQLYLDRVFPSRFEFESLSAAVSMTMCWSISAQLYSYVLQINDLLRRRLDQCIDLEHLLAHTDITVPGIMGTSKYQSLGSLSRAAHRDHLVQNLQEEGTRMSRHVCESLEYFQRPEMGTYGSHAVTYPRWSATQYFRLHPGHEREQAWLQNMHKMEGHGTRWGFSTMTFTDIKCPLGGWPK
ncbi:hypothetical protein F5Y15DRAFT_430174 [Xylariaceae sp. FL0016]|nr:hypothetical protein F5Y15DRAFT_430174 [Xylariaceae sp. FL0016]